MLEETERALTHNCWRCFITSSSLQEKNKKLKEIEDSGHHFVEENLNVAKYLSERETKLAVKKHKDTMKRYAAVQKRNARQFDKLVHKVSNTREAINARKMRQLAMAEFIMQQGLKKSNNVTKSWMAILVLSRTSVRWSHVLKAHRLKVQAKARVSAMTAISIFLLHKFKAKRRRKAANVLLGFLRFLKRDGQIKQVAKKLKWVLMKLQKMLRAHLVCNRAQVELLSKKFELVVRETPHLSETEEEKRLEPEKNAGRSKFVGTSHRGGSDLAEVPPEEVPLADSVKSSVIRDWVIQNRQNHVIKLIAYEKYEIWPVLVDMVRCLFDDVGRRGLE